MNRFTRGQRYAILTTISGLVLVFAVLLNANGAATAGGVITWSDGTTGNLYQINSDGTGAAPVVTGAANTLLDVDTDGTYLYWVENNSLVINYIGRSNVDGTSPQSDWLDTSTVSTRTWGIAVNDTHIYWTDPVSDCIYRANIDGTGATVLITLADAFPGSSPDTYDIAVDDTSIYWTDGTEDNIYKANLDGSNPQILVDLGALYTGLYGSSSSRAYGIVVYDSYIYWTDQGPDKVFRAGTDGSGAAEFIDPAVAIASASYGPYGITTDGTYLYWADPIPDAIYKANLDGTGAMTFTQTSAIGSTNPRYLAYDLDAANAVTLMGLQNQTYWILPIVVAGIIVLIIASTRMRKTRNSPH